MGYVDLVRCVLELRCGMAVVVWYPYAGFSLHMDTPLKGVFFYLTRNAKILQAIKQENVVHAQTQKFYWQPDSRLCTVHNLTLPSGHERG